MNLWSDTDFMQVALGSKMDQRLMAACRDILVAGLSPADAATKHQMFMSAIDRATGTLRETQDRQIDPAVPDLATREFMKLTAIQAARNIVGQAFPVREAKPGGLYLGPVITNTQGFVVQKTGRSCVIYDLDQFQDPPRMGETLYIEVPVLGGPLFVKPDRSSHGQATTTIHIQNFVFVQLPSPTPPDAPAA